jgi:hypothetical protein
MSNKLINLKTIKMSKTIKTSKMIKPIQKNETILSPEEYFAVHGIVWSKDELENYYKNYREPKELLQLEKQKPSNPIPNPQISRDDIMDAIDNLGKVSLVAASGGYFNDAAKWEYLTFESDLDDNNEYYYFDMWNNWTMSDNKEDGYTIKFQHKRQIQDSDGEWEDDEAFGVDTIEEYTVYSLDQIIEIHNKVFNK